MVIRVSKVVAFSDVHSQQQVHARIQLMEDVASGLDDVEAGRTVPAAQAVEILRQRLATKGKSDG